MRSMKRALVSAMIAVVTHYSLLITHYSFASEVASHRIETGGDYVGRGGEGEAQVALAVLAEDGAGGGGDLRALKQEIGGGAAVCAEARHFGEGVESSVRRRAR